MTKTDRSIDENQPLARLAGVVQRFGDPPRTILDGVDLEVRRGEVLALLGPSGCGKSTLLRLLIGLARPSEGTVHCDGRELDGPRPQTALVFQDFALLPWLSVRDNVAVGLGAGAVAASAPDDAAAIAGAAPSPPAVVAATAPEGGRNLASECRSVYRCC